MEESNPHKNDLDKFNSKKDRKEFLTDDEILVALKRLKMKYNDLLKKLRDIS